MSQGTLSEAFQNSIFALKGKKDFYAHSIKKIIKNIEGWFIRNLGQENFAFNVEKFIGIAFLLALGKVLWDTVSCMERTLAWDRLDYVRHKKQC